jgi:serine/threonine protein kinase
MLIPAPEIKNFEDGFIKCPSCSAEIPLASATPLEIMNCPHCPGQVLIPLKVKDYWLYSPLGGGGMGSVYKAVSKTGHGKEYAVKVLPRHEKANQDFIKALLHEGNAGMSFGSHANIIAVIECGVDGDEHFLVTEFVDGDRLDTIVASEKKIPEKRAIGIILQVLEAEIHILKCGYLFRDLKPQNVIIDKTGTARLFDYGLCATPEEAAESNLADDVQGSPFYIPPERILGVPEREYSEIYSLGMVFFHMLAGRTYYSLAEVNELVTKHLTSLRAKSVDTYLKDCNSSTIAIIDRMIARTPEKRYQDFNSLKRDLLEQLNARLKDGASMISPVISRALKKSLKKKTHVVSIAFAGILLFAVAAVFVSRGCSVHKKTVSIRQKADNLEKLRKTLRESTAAELGVPADIKPPLMDPDKLREKIEETAKKIISGKTSELKAFNEQESRKTICNSLNVDPSDRDFASVDEVKRKMQDEIRAVAENEIKKIDRSFNEDAEIRRIASEMKIELPVKDPSVSLKDVDAEFKVYIQKKIDGKYSLKTQSARILEIDRKFRGYREGDNIEINDIKGVYGGKAGNKVIIGSRHILLSDLPATERWKFNEFDCEERIRKMTEQYLNEIKSDKEKYVKEIEASEKPGFYGNYGYFPSGGGAFKPPRAVIEEKIKKLKAARQHEISKKEKSIRDAAESKFDRIAYMKKNHLRETDGVWRTESEVVGILLAKEKESFESRRKTLLESISKSAYADAEKQVYTSDGYVFRENKWQSARKLIDDTVAAKMEKEGKE